MTKTPLPIALEDNHTDVIRKAMRGLGITTGDLTVQSGLTASEVDKLLAWPPRWEDADQLPPLIMAVARVLHLNPRALETLTLSSRSRPIIEKKR